MLKEKIIIIFDFDGVIANTTKECFLVAWWAYHGVEELTAAMFRNNHEREKAETLFNQFRYLVAPAHEYYFLLKAIFEYLETCKGELPNLFKKNSLKCEQEAMAFSIKFFRIRDFARSKFRRQWLDLNPLYPGMAEFLRKYLKRQIVFISSTKDKNSIESILKENQIKIPREHIFGKEQGTDKRVHIRSILQQTGFAATRTFFIDDNPLHLVQVKPLGVHLLFANWGYGGPNGEAASLAFEGNIVNNIKQLKKIVI